jgi:CheY-like chemotaxis protein
VTTTIAPKSVLIVDDETDLRESLREVLEDEGYQVQVAADGREAMARLNTARPCVVILDLIMPVMSGNEVYDAMQADPNLAGIPVIVSTSDPSRSPSGVPIMKKPVNIERLIQLVAKLC